jgi:hypothetical protein
VLGMNIAQPGSGFDLCFDGWQQSEKRHQSVPLRLGFFTVWIRHSALHAGKKLFLVEAKC